MSNYIVSASPHIRDRVTSQRIMLDVIIALVPALIAAITVFGLRAALVVFVCVATCVLAEFIWQKLMKKTVSVGDRTAVVTGIQLAYTLPVNIPLWQAMEGAVVAIIVVKQHFGGVGKNFANPAITARIVMFLAFSVSMTNFVSVDGVSSATPLALITAGRIEELPSLTNMLLGVRGGCLGETSVIALVIGGVYLICRKVITWHTPVVYLATVFVFTLLLGQQPVYQVMSGGLMLGAIFMATDYVTTPYTAIGKVIFGLGAGILTVIIRVYGSYAEGVSYSILLMNILTPYINRIRVRLPVGGARA